MLLVLQIFIVIITLIGVGIIVLTKNIIHAAYALALALIGIAGVYVLLGSELLAVVQILLYAGGVVILLSFGVMMTNRLRGERVLSESRNRVVAGLISITVFGILSYLFSGMNLYHEKGTKVDQVRNIGISFFTEHIVAFELIAFILLVALVGSTLLAKMSSDD
ncbi:MAG: NADH-quinone oxidoreductase subunit J [Bacteroidota bacterium]